MSLTFLEYQLECKKLFLLEERHASFNEKVLYLTAKLPGEAWEFWQTKAPHEIGDQLWYAALLLYYLAPTTTVADVLWSKRIVLSQDTTVVPSLASCIEVGQRVAKFVRDGTDNGIAESILNALRVLRQCAGLLGDTELTLERIAKANLKKLRDRAKRGAIQGSGDNR